MKKNFAENITHHLPLFRKKRYGERERGKENKKKDEKTKERDR